MDELHRLRFFAAQAYATQMSLFNSFPSQSLSQALTAASMQSPSSFSTAGSAGAMSGISGTSGLSRAWLSSSTDSSDSVNVSGNARSQSPADQRSGSSPGQQQQRVMTCPLCGLSLEGPDVSSHFYEEVHKMETFRSTLRFERLNHWAGGGKDMVSSGSSPLALSGWPSNGSDPLSDLHHHPHHHQQQVAAAHQRLSRHHSPYDCVDSSSSAACKRLRFPGDKLQPCSRWQTYQRVRQNRQSRLEGLLRCKRMRIDDKQEKSSTTSSPQASPGSTICGNGNSGTNNNSITSGGGGGSSNAGIGMTGEKTNGQQGRIWSIVSDMDDRQENSVSVSRNWSPLRISEEKEILRQKTRSIDLSQTIIADDHIHSKTEVESDARSVDERSDAGSSGGETSVDVEVEVI